MRLVIGFKSLKTLSAIAVIEHNINYKKVNDDCKKEIDILKQWKKSLGTLCSDGAFSSGTYQLTLFNNGHINFNPMLYDMFFRLRLVIKQGNLTTQLTRLMQFCTIHNHINVLSIIRKKLNNDSLFFMILLHSYTNKNVGYSTLHKIDNDVSNKTSDMYKMVCAY
jgi:hypothetical protein